MNIKQALQKATEKLEKNNIPSAYLDAEVLLLAALNKNVEKSWLYINQNLVLKKETLELFNGLINRRNKNEPVAYLLGKKEFFGYEFFVNKNVLIPRPETEFIVENVLTIIKEINDDDKKINLIDIGTGSGCIIISILKKLAEKNINYNAYANDISQKAISVAKNNTEKHQLEKQIKFITDNFENFIKNNIDLFSKQFILTANLPYIKDEEYKNLSPNVKKYEPKIALTGGGDGLDLIIKLINLIAEIKTKEKGNNYLLLEADPPQIRKIKTILKEKLNTSEIKTIKDFSNEDRIIIVKI